MQGVITAITVQKKNPHRFNIFIDQAYAFSLGENLARDLAIGGTLPPSAIADLKTADEKESAFTRALYYLSFRPRSRREVERYLSGKDFSADAITQSLSRLENLGYLNDREFARMWVENRSRFKPKGAFVLGGELRGKGIDADIIRETLAGLDEVEAAWRAALGRLPRLTPNGRTEEDRKIFQQKLLGFLSRRGFSWDVCRALCDRAWEELLKA